MIDKTQSRFARMLLIGVAFFAVAFFAPLFHVAQAATTSTNISSGGNAHWAWNDAIGWIDFYTPGTVTVSPSGITGYANSSVGYISFDCHTSPSGNICGTPATYQVTNDGAGNLTGWAWNDGIGWISFDCHNTNSCGTSSYQVTIDANGNFQGWAWNDLVGWIDLNCHNGTSICGTSNFYVNSTWVATGTIGMLDSITYDTGVVGGAQLDSVEWQGAAVPGGSVQFQFAVSNAPSGPWNFIGSDGTINSYFVPSGPGVLLPLTFGPNISQTLFTNYRYFRYRATLISTPTSTPSVDNVIVNWSP